uniref:Secreted protein n=1 Tax=Parascaris univalens TaxID=6257 RepID=A0A914ZRF3_PARUN
MYEMISNCAVAFMFLFCFLSLFGQLRLSDQWHFEKGALIYRFLSLSVHKWIPSQKSYDRHNSQIMSKAMKFFNAFMSQLLKK